MKPSPSPRHIEFTAENIKEHRLLAILSKDEAKTFKIVALWKYKVALGDLRWHLRVQKGYLAILIDIQEQHYG